MLAFVFCLHAHLKRFQAIITQTECHISKMYTTFTHTKMHTHAHTLTQCYLKCRSITFTRQCNVIKISSCISHSTLSLYQMRHPIVNRCCFFLLLLVYRYRASIFVHGQGWEVNNDCLTANLCVRECLCDVRKMVNTFSVRMTIWLIEIKAAQFMV